MKIIEPCTLAIFGAGGNLSQRKLIPALFRLEVAKHLPEKMVILGCDIVVRTDDDWLQLVSEILHGIYPTASIVFSIIPIGVIRYFYRVRIKHALIGLGMAGITVA